MKLLNITRRALSAAVWTLFLAAAPVALAAPELETGFDLPRDVSLHGHRIDWLIKITGLFTFILFVVMCVWMFIACRKHGREHQAEYDHGDSKHSVTVALALSIGIFLIVDGNLLINSMIDLDQAFWAYDEAEAHPDAVLIEINAHQWAWDARYAGKDGRFNTPDDIVTLNDVRIPVDVPVTFQIAATDVIHSFNLPNLRRKKDAIPGTVTRMWVQAVETGEFDIACAQHCGTNHYKMKGLLTILPRHDYEAWAEQASAIAALAYDPADTDAHWGWEWEEL